MFYIYVLRSLKNHKRYVGHTSKDVFQRLLEHHNHSNPWTAHNGPFILIYHEASATKKEAMKREHFLKSGQGIQWLDEHIPG